MGGDSKHVVWGRLAGVTLKTAAILLALGLSAGCASTVNPATGQRQYTSLSQADEQRIGAQEHPKVLKQFGGVYDNPKIGGYVAQIGGRLAANSELPKQKWTFTVLDSPIVNAFALPGGYIYISRGLMSLANSEAELAGVLGHEIGHVTGRHTAQRVTRAQAVGVGGLLASIGAAALGVDPRLAGQLAQVAGQGYVASFSRSQELEADQLGVRYLARTGYDPFAQADFLANLQAQSTLQSRLSGGGYDPNRVDFFATHPATAQRVREAAAAAQRAGININQGAPRRRDAYLRLIDGMIYGDSPEKGYVKGATFEHPALRFKFSFPKGYQVVNSDKAVSAKGPKGQSIIFDGGSAHSGSMAAYIQQKWVPALAQKSRISQPRKLDEFEVNGLPGATAVVSAATSKGEVEARLIAINAGDRVYRFTALYPPQLSGAMQEPLQRMSYSFRKLSAAQAAALKPLRVRVIKVKSGDTVAGLARRMAQSGDREARFRVLNGLGPKDQLQAGQLVKIVTEG